MYIEPEEVKKYKYIFGIRNEFNKRNLESSTEPDFFLEIPNTKEVKNDLVEMKAMINNKMAPTSTEEALEAFDLVELSHSLAGIKFRVVSNNLTVHMINTQFPLRREDFDMWVRSANVVPSTKQFLIDCKIKF